MKKLLSVSMVLLVLVGMLGLYFRIESARSEPRTWTVDDDGPADFHTIQEAIDASGNGDTVYVKSGVYYENVTVNKLSLLLIGENMSATIIDANQTLGTPITIVANNIYLGGFTVRNSGRTQPGAFISYPSISIEDCNGSIITGNMMMEDNSFDLRLYGSSNCMIFNNTIRKYGIRLYPSRSINRPCSNNTVFGNAISDGDILIYASRNNTISGNKLSDAGIKIDKSNDNLVSDNTVSGAYDRDWWRLSAAGVGLFDCNNNRILNNTLSASRYGVFLSSSTGNFLSGNDMSENVYDFSVFGTMDTPSHWDNYVDSTNVASNKSVCYLVGKDSVVLDWRTNVGTVYLFNCRNITVGDLTLERNGAGVFLMNTSNSRIENVTTDSNQYGIVLGCSTNNTVTGNKVSDNDGHGIWLSRSDLNLLKGNSVSGNYDYHSSAKAVGIDLYSSNNNTISENSIDGNEQCGIRLENSSRSVLSHNDVFHNYDYGIMLVSSSNSNMVFNNAVSDEYRGILLETSGNNTFFHNNFISTYRTTKQAISSGQNHWDNGYPSGGNYWSDHNPSDSDKDKIGDLLYAIDENNTDRYPLVYPFECYESGYICSPDLNMDGFVNIIDVSKVAKAFGCKPADSNWNPVADMDLNEVINIVDISKVAKEFGKEWKVT